MSKKCTYWPLGLESEPPIALRFGICIVVLFVSTFGIIFAVPHIPHVTSSPKHPIVEIVCIITHAVWKKNMVSKKRIEKEPMTPKVWQTRSTVAYFVQTRVSLSKGVKKNKRAEAWKRSWCIALTWMEVNWRATSTSWVLVHTTKRVWNIHCDQHRRLDEDVFRKMQRIFSAQCNVSLFF